MRILHVVSAMNRGGTETLLMNVYRTLDRSKVQFDFVSHRQTLCDYDREIEELGGRIFRIPSLGQLGPIKYLRTLQDIIKTNGYQVVHGHTDYQTGFVALAARLAGVKKRVCHAHTNKWLQSYSMKQKLTLIGLQTLINTMGTDYCACSEEAGRFLFGLRKLEHDRIHILNNGINLNAFNEITPLDVEKMKVALDIPKDTRVIGHVGNFSEVKNQSFIIKILQKLLQENEKVTGLFVGDGPLQEKVRNEVIQLGLSDHVRFLGVREDIPLLMTCFDAFIFPSLFEGFGLVALEAQAAGTPCIMSNQVPRTTDMRLGITRYLNLDENLSRWTESVKEAFKKEPPQRDEIRNAFTKLGFSIDQTAGDWLSLYGVELE